MKNILVVDDESKIRNIYRNLLSNKEFRIIEVSNAPAAYDVLAREKMDLVLLDINMPEIDGSLVYELIETFHLRTKVIVCSVLPISEQKQMIKGKVDYYDKSEGIEALQAKVKNILLQE